MSIQLQIAYARMEAAYEAIIVLEANQMFAGPERIEYDEARSAYLALL